MQIYSIGIGVLGIVTLGNVKGANLLLNSGFEAELGGGAQMAVGNWQTFSGGAASATRQALLPATGDFHLGLQLFSGDSYAGVFQGVEIMGGEVLNFSGAHFGLPLTGSEVRLEYFDDAGVEIGRSQNYEPVVPLAYRRFSYDFTAPESARTARAVYVIQSFGGRNDGSVGLDNFSLSAVPEPSSAILLGVAFLSLVGRRNRKV